MLEDDSLGFTEEERRMCEEMDEDELLDEEESDKDEDVSDLTRKIESL